jgi:hypothetical protein
MADIKGKLPKSEQAPPRVAWLTCSEYPPRPKGAHFTIAALDMLWRALELGDCSGVFVDRRYKCPEGDAWEVALTIRERYPLLPLSVMAPVDFVAPRPGRKSIYVSQEL